MVRLDNTHPYSTIGQGQSAGGGHSTKSKSEATPDPVDSVKIAGNNGRETKLGDGQHASYGYRLTQLGVKSRDQLKQVMNALPRDAHGRLDPDLLVDESKRTTLTDAVERLVLEGLGTGADVAFEQAVHALFAEYADDMNLDEAELNQAKKLMLREVREVIADDKIRPWSAEEPAPAHADLDALIERLQARVQHRRRSVLEASGDLSRVLAELTVEARSGGDSERLALGSFLDRMAGAMKNRSSLALRREARDRLMSSAVSQPTPPQHEGLAQRFLKNVSTG
ncbi:MAG: hypothetical protein VX589_15275 [Myxococcota bacterium]|nr:hypothetical protein [Myxococcota bacterium]